MKANDDEKISVIVPIYKVEEYLERCVRSIQNQLYKNLEIILVDDGSPDRCPKMCDAFAQSDSRIRVIHKPNGGLSDARNAGIEASTGEYITFLDSDDWIDPPMLAHLLWLCKAHNAAIGECSYRCLLPDEVRAESACTGAVLERTPVQAIEDNLDWKNCKPVAWNKLYRRDVIRNVRYPVGKLHEDEFTTHKFYLEASKIVYVDVAYYNYDCRRSGSITAEFKLKNLDACEAFRQKIHLVWQTPELQSLDEKMCNTYCYVLFDRLSECVQNRLEGSELTQTIRNALDEYPTLCQHGIDKKYRDCFDLLKRNGLEDSVRAWNQ